MLLFLFLFALASWLFYELHWKRRGLPPGPLPIPLVGNILSLFLEPPGFSVYQRWKDAYGPLYTYWLSVMPIVSANDYDTITEMFVKDADNYADRVKFGKFSEEFKGGDYGLVDTSGPLWREQRRFALHTLRDFGLGKPRMQERMLNEAECLMTTLEEASKKGGVEMIPHLERTVASVINIVIFGYRFDETNIHGFTKLRGGIDRVMKELRNPLMLAAIALPWTKNLPVFRDKFKAFEQIRVDAFEFLDDNVKRHRETIDFTNDDAEDFAEAFLKEQHRQKDDPESTFSDQQLKVTCLDLWVAGIDTTASTMAWGTMLLLHHPEVIHRMHEEFDAVINADRLITMQDKSRLPYTNAFIAETQRWTNIVAQNFLRKASRYATVNGMEIKAGTIVCPQISALLYDPVVFPDPERFDPIRFIDDSGAFVQIKHLMAFSVGKRACPGEGLARMELFLFFANLLHRFDISPDPSEPLPSLKRTFSTTAKPAAFRCILKRRTINSH